MILSIEDLSNHSVEVRWLDERVLETNGSLLYLINYNISVVDILVTSGNSSVIPEDDSTIEFSHVIMDILPGVTVSVSIQVSDVDGTSEVNSTSTSIPGGR